MMNKSHIYIILSFIFAMASGCSAVEEFEEPVQKIDRTFYATLEGRSDTKTVLGTKDENGIRNLLWMPEDSIGVAAVGGSAFDLFVNSVSDTAAIAVFEGSTENASSYYAFYPYDENTKISNGRISFSLNDELSYKAGSFDRGAFPMIARSSDSMDNGFSFLNLCGVLELNITGEEKITSITFFSDNIVSGDFTVRTDYTDYPEIVAAGSSNSTSIKLNCGEGVQLNATSPTTFYFVLPPGEYRTFNLVFNTVDGKRMFKQGAKPLTIKRSVITAAGALEYIESVEIDLSRRGTSNCYIVPGVNMYCFNASVIGNGAFGFIPDAYVHSTETVITPTSVEVLWESKGAIVKADEGELLYDVTLKDGYVYFISTGVEGNALVAVKDNKERILWSWHLWFTDIPSDLKYTGTNGSYVVLDRNIGAIRADSGSDNTERKESWGAMYQWGRKDPFVQNCYSYHTFRSETDWTIAESIQEPTNMCVATGIIGGTDWTDEPMGGLWKEGAKTIYDPCPVGYRVADKNIWYGFTRTNGKATENVSDFLVSGKFQEGWNFLYDGVNTTWYPATDYHYVFNDYLRYDSTCYLWSSTQTSLLTVKSDKFDPHGTECGIMGHPVRCMKEDMTSALQIEMLGTSDAKSTSVYAKAMVFVQGGMEVTRSGFVLGDNASVDIENGRVIDADTNVGDISMTIDGLAPLSRYYIKAFAVAEGKTYYSDVTLPFMTSGSDGIINLSLLGSANCYIVKPDKATYSFDLVKGNSSESVGAAASAAVLWETYNTDEFVTEGSVVSSVSVDGDKAVLKISENAVPGNALVAVKDAAGTILWSWHIWVTDLIPDITSQKYPSGAVLMDRHLGALTAVKDDPRTNGLFYQWGRKDPFIGYFNSKNNQFASSYPEEANSAIDSGSADYQYSISHPTVSIRGGSQWCDGQRWSNKKTIYDPCPAGWRVPDGNPGVWDGAETNITIYYNVGVKLDSTVPQAYYPTSGFVDRNGSGDGNTLYGWTWTCTLNPDDVAADSRPYALMVSSFTNGSVQTGNRRQRGDHYTVRCMKEDNSDKTGNGDDYIVDDEYEWE